MSKAELNALGHLLASAGSDEGTVYLNRYHTELLGLLDCEEIVEITELPPRFQGYLTAETPKIDPIKKEILAVEPVRNNPDDEDEIVKSYKVHIGTARKALEKKLGGKRLEGCRQKDAEMPVTQDEPATV